MSHIRTASDRLYCFDCWYCLTNGERVHLCYSDECECECET